MTKRGLGLLGVLPPGKEASVGVHWTILSNHELQQLLALDLQHQAQGCLQSVASQVAGLEEQGQKATEMLEIGAG